MEFFEKKFRKHCFKYINIKLPVRTHSSVKQRFGSVTFKKCYIKI